MSALQLLGGGGEVIDAVDAPALLAAAGLTDLSAVDVTELAAFDDRAGELLGIVKEARGLSSDELVRRLDQHGKWTLREDGWEIKSSSPEAGTVAYDTPRLRDALADLVAREVVAPEGAAAALEEVHAPASVPYDVLREVVAALRGDLPVDAEQRLALAIDGLLAFEGDPTYRQKPAGIKALLKLPAAKAAIEACQVTVEPPRRVAKVKRIETAS